MEHTQKEEEETVWQRYGFLFDYQKREEVEDARDYNIGGYHPIFIGEVFQDRYIFLKKLQSTFYS